MTIILLNATDILIRDDGGIQIASLLTVNSSITFLDLSRNMNKDRAKSMSKLQKILCR